jgi:hypothetical protein
MGNTGRDEKGMFMKGRKPTAEELQKKAEGMKRHYETFAPKARVREQNPYIYNSWRAMLYTEKGKKAGCNTPEWREFEVFLEDVKPSYKPGYRFCRIDSSIPFSRDNFIWLTPEQAQLKGRAKHLIYLDYKGEHLTTKELAIKYNVSSRGIAVRYHKYKDKMSVEEIIFGKRVARGTKTPKDAPTNSQEERNKVSKMISIYKCLDRQRGFDLCDMSIDWMVENILHKPCVYCGDTHKIGCDRIDNNKGHLKSNAVPCCYTCNTVRNNNFSYDEMKILGKTIKKIKAARQIK